MATRLNCIEYAWGNIATATNEGSTLTSGDITVHIPNVTSRTFVNAWLEVTCHDNEATVADNLTGVTVGLSCNGGTNWTDTTVAGAAFNQSGENMAFVFTADVTAELTARFGSGASNSTTRFRLSLDYNNTGNQFLNVSVKLIINYTYSDTSDDQIIKTVRIPIESLAARLASATRTQIGTNQIPALDTFLPETGKTYRAIFAELWYNTAPAGTTDSTVVFDLDAGASPTLTTGTYENGNASAMLVRTIWDLLAAGMTTNAAHAIYGTASSVGMCSGVGGWITVTYEYDDGNQSGEIMNSVVIPAGSDEFYVFFGSTESRRNVKYVVAEPTTITLRQSAIVCIGAAWVADRPFRVKVGSQSFRTYDLDQASDHSGEQQVVHRIDSGGAAGAYGTLAKGENTLAATWDGNGTNLSGVRAFYILNYTSGKSAQGSICHNRTHKKLLLSNLFTATAAQAVVYTAAAPIVIPETNYFINAMMFRVGMNNTTAQSFAFGIIRASGDAINSGIKSLGSFHAPSFPSERAENTYLFDSTFAFKQHPSDTREDRLDIEVSRTLVGYTLVGGYFNLIAVVTYHVITHTKTFQLEGYSGDGSGITVDVFRDDTDEKIASGVSAAGGASNIILYDDAMTIYGVARQSTGREGRSRNTVATE